MATPTFTQNTAMFDPRQFPGLFIWNDSSDLTGTNGLALTSNVWRNKALDTTYASSCSTTARLSTNTLNGFPVMDFLTTNTYVFHNTVLNLADATMVFITRNIGTTANSRRIMQGSNVNNLYGYWSGNKNVLFLNNSPNFLPPSGGGSAPAVASDCNWDLYSLYKSQKGPYTWARFGSNMSIATGSGQPFNGLCINTGTAGTGGGETTACQVAEILCYSNALLPEQVWAIEGYLAWKWGLQSNLPSYHPYVSSMVFTKQPTPLQMSNAPFIWIDANYRPYQALTGNNITTLSNLGFSGVNFLSNVSPTALANTNAFGSLSTFRLPAGATMTYSGAITSNARSVVFITRNTTSLGTSGFLGILNTSNVAAGQNFYFAASATTCNVLIGPNGVGFNVGFTCVNNILNNINFYTLVDAQNTSFNRGSENGTVRTLTNNGTSAYAQGSGVYILNTPGYNTAQDLGELIQFQYDLSPAERQMMEGYIAWKWVQTASLPTLHPFKLYPPITPVFSPLAIFGQNTTTAGRGSLQCVLWMDATQDSTANGASVTSVADRSGSGYSIVPVAGNTVTKTVPGLNGLPVFNFGPNRMTVTNFVWRTKFTCFFVTQTNLGNWLYSQMFSGTYFNYVFAGNQSLALIDVNASVNDSVNASGVSVTGTSWNIFVFGYNNGSTGTPYRVNGTTRTTTNINIVKGDLTTNTNLFLNGNQNGQFDTSQVAEILHYNDNLTLGQTQKVEGYLAWKWGLVSNLPVSHPYRTAPP